MKVKPTKEVRFKDVWYKPGEELPEGYIIKETLVEKPKKQKKSEVE